MCERDYVDLNDNYFEQNIWHPEFGWKHTENKNHVPSEFGWKVLSTGLEPMTLALSEPRATNCAKRAEFVLLRDRVQLEGLKIIIEFVFQGGLRHLETASAYLRVGREVRGSRL